MKIKKREVKPPFLNFYDFGSGAVQIVANKVKVIKAQKTILIGSPGIIDGVTTSVAPVAFTNACAASLISSS